MLLYQMDINFFKIIIYNKSRGKTSKPSILFNNRPAFGNLVILDPLEY